MEKILTANEFWSQNNCRDTFELMDKYAKYLLEKQSEFIAEKMLLTHYKNRITQASTEFIKNIEL